MNKGEIAANAFGPINCAQAVLSAYAGDYDLEKDKALQVAVAFGGGMGRMQETCGAVSGALIALGLSSGFKDGDGRDKINVVYDKVYDLITDFTELNKTVKCRDLLGCDLRTEEGREFFKENNLRENCKSYIRLACKLLDKYIF